MSGLLASDPGAWNIIAWMLLLSAVGMLILWVVTTLLLRNGSVEVPRGGIERRDPSS